MGSSPGLRHPGPADGPSLWALAGECGLDRNSHYAYAMWAEYFADTSLVAVDGDRVIGFVTGFRVPRRPDTVFVWQVAVAAEHRRKGLAGRMLDEIVARTGAARIEATRTRSNTASAALFRSLAERHGGAVVESVLFGSELLSDGHQPEIRLRVALGNPGPPTTRGRETSDSN